MTTCGVLIDRRPRTALLLACSLLIGCAARPADAQEPAPRAPTAPTAERIYGLSLIWREATYNYPYVSRMQELDWDAEYRRHVVEAIEAPATFDYYRVLQRFAALLRDGHTRVQMPDSMLQREPFSSPGIALIDVEGAALVENVTTDLAARFPIGTEILEVDGLPVRDYLDEHVLPYVYASAPHIRIERAIEGSHSRGYGLLVGERGTSLVVRARTPAGEEVRASLVRDRGAYAGTWVHEEAERSPLLDLSWPEEGIAWLRLNDFSDPAIVAQLDGILPALRRAQGVILDLRSNGGGSDLIGLAVLARFSTGRVTGTGSQVRINDGYHRALGSFGREALNAALPAGSEDLIDLAVRHFDGSALRIEAPDTIALADVPSRVDVPVTLLIGSGTASAAENFAVLAHGLPGFVSMGSPTAGSTGQPLRFPLPGGGFAQIVSRVAVLPNGIPVGVAGVEPQVRVRRSVEDVRRGHDPVMTAAVAHLRSRIGPPAQ